MTAIVAGQGLGLTNTSANLLGSGGQQGLAAVGRSGEKVYVNAANGNLVVQQQDEWLVGRGPDVAVLRTYNSLATSDGDNGDNWRLGLSRKVYGASGTLNMAGSTVTRVGEDGAQSLFTFDTSRALYVSKDGTGSFDTLSWDAASNSWTWTDGNSRVQERYDGLNGGRLTQVVDTDGNALTVVYNASGLVNLVTDANGEKTYIDYDTSAGKTANITQIRTVDSNNATRTRVRYDYDSANRLSSVTVDLSPTDNSVTDGETSVTNYTYDGASTRIASITQTDGSRIEFTYDAAGRVDTVKDVRGADVRTTDFDYSVVGQTTVTDALGQATRLTYSTAAGQDSAQLLSVVTPAVNGSSATTSYTYDADGNVASITDARGNPTVYGYDGAGNCTYERDAAGNVIERIFGASNQLLNETHYATPDPDGAGPSLPASPLTTRYVYDAKNRLRFEVTPDGRITEHRYNTAGQRVKTQQYTNGKYDLSGVTATTTLSESQLAARVATFSSSQIQLVDYTYDLRGQISTKVTYASLNPTTGAGVVDGTQSTTQYIYDQGGKLLQTIDARGVATASVPNDYVTTYTYDGLNRVLTQTDALGNTTTTVYSDAARQTTVTAANGLVTVSNYDQAGQLLSVVRSSGSTGLGTTTYGYDKLGRLVKTTDPTNLSSYKLYDAAGRLVGDIDGQLALTEYVYNGDNQLVRTIEYANKVSAAAISSLDANPALALTSVRPTLATGADRTTQRLYDAAGRLVKTIDAAGAVTEYRYDGANRLTDVIAYANTLTSTQLANIAALTTELLQDNTNATPVANNADDRRTRSLYNVDGMLVATLDAEGYLTEYSYDDAGRRTQALRYANQTNGSYWIGGTLSTLRPTVDLTKDQSTYWLYNVRGQLEGMVDAEGYLTEYQYDLAGNKTSEIRYATKVTSAGNLLSYSNDLDNPAWSKMAGGTGTAPVVAKDYAAALDGSLTAERVQLSLAGGTTANDWSFLRQTIKNLPLGSYTGQIYVKATDAANVGKTVLFRQAGSNSYKAQTLTADWIPITTVETKSGTYNAVFDIALRGTFGPTDSVDFLICGAQLRPTAVSTIRPTANAEDQKILCQYDALNRLTRQENLPTGLVTTFSYDTAGNLTQTVRGLGAAGTDQRIDLRKYDALGRVTAELDARGAAALAQLPVGATQSQIDAVWNTYGTRYTYDQAGRRLSMVTPNGVDAIGNKTLYYYDTEARLTHTVNALGEVVENYYNLFGEQVSHKSYGTRIATAILATLTGGLTNTLVTILNSLADANVDSSMGTEYDQRGLATKLTDALGNATSLSYSAFGQLTQRSDTVGADTSSYDRRGLLISTVADASTGKLNLQTQRMYDAFGRLTQTTDARGIITSKRNYDRLGREVSTVDALNITRGTTYDAFSRVLSQTDGRGQTTTTTYNSAASSFTVTTPEGISTTTVTNRHGQTVSITDGRGATTTFDYDSDGQLKTKTAPVVGASSFTYDAAGRLTAEVDARGTTVSYTYDAADRVLIRTVDPSGLNLQTSYTYDAIGRVAIVRDGMLGATSTCYDANGRVSDIFVCDAYGLTLTHTGYTYDVRGNTLTVIEGYTPSKTTLYTYDGAGRRTRHAVDPNGLNITTDFTYDPAGNMVATTDKLGNVTRYAYDADNRLVYTVDATGAVLKNDYDNEGHVVRATAYASRISLSSPTALALAATPDDIKARIATSTNDQVQSSAYDKDGRLRFGIDANNFVTELTYDNAGNVVKRTRYANAMVGSLALGQSPSVLTAAGTAPYVVKDTTRDQVEQTVWDLAGRAMVDIDAAGYVTERQFDANSNVIQTTRYANALAGTFAPNQVPQFVSTAAGVGSWVIVDAAHDQTVRTVYDRANRTAFVIDAEGYVTRTTHDNAGQTQVTRFVNKLGGTFTANTPPAVVAMAPDNGSWVITSTDDATTTDRYDAAGHLKEETDALGVATYRMYDDAGRLTDVIASFSTAGRSTTHYGYDAAGRLTDETKGYGTAAASTTRYAYDGAGRLTDETVAFGTTAAATTHYGYDTVGHRTQKIEAFGKTEAATTLTDYDAFGNAAKVTDAKQNAGYFYFDKLNRVTLHIDPEGYAVATTYDAFGMANSVKRYANKVVGAPTVGSPPPVVSKATGSLYILATSATDQTTTINHDLRNLQTKITDAEQYWEGQSYDAFGNKQNFTNKDGGVFSYTYDRNNRLLTETLPVTAPNAGQVQVPVVNSYSYDARGNRTRTIEAVGLPEQRITNFTYDKVDRLSSRSGETMTIRVNGVTTSNFTPTETRIYDKRGNLIEQKDPSGARTLSYYDALDRKTAEINAIGTLTTYTYNAAGDRISQRIYADAITLPATVGLVAPPPRDATKYRETIFTYDGLHRLKTTTIQSVRVANSDSNGNWNPTVADVVTTRVYDVVGNVVQEIDARGNSVYSFYNKLGQRVLKVDQERYASTWTYDALGNITTETRYANAVPATTNVTTSSVASTIVAAISASTANDRTTVFVYDRLGHVKQEQQLSVAASTVNVANGQISTTTGTATTSYTYNGLGKVLTKTDALGQVVTYAYDKLGNQTHQQGASFIDYSGTAVARVTDTEYNGLGLVARNIERGSNNASEADDHITYYTYGKNGVLASQTDPAATTTFTYDASGRVSSKSLTRLDADGVSCTDSTEYVYDLQGRQTQQLVKMTAGGVTSTLQTNEIRYDAYGQIVAKGTNGGWQEFAEYDAKTGWLVKSNSGSGVTKAYFYDANGNATLTVDSSGAELKPVAIDQVLNQPNIDLTISAYDKRNLLTDTFSPTLSQVEHILQAYQNVSQMQGALLNGGAPILTTAPLAASSATLPAANGRVSIGNTMTFSAIGSSSYTGNSWWVSDSMGDSGSGYTTYYSVLTGASHTVTLTMPDTSAWGSGDLVVYFYLQPLEGVLSGYSNTFNITNGVKPPPIRIDETLLGGATQSIASPRNYSIQIFKRLEDGSGMIYLGSQSGSGFGSDKAVTSISGTIATKQITFRPPPNAGYAGAQVARVVMLSRPAGGNAGWNIYEAASSGSSMFYVDWSGWTRQSYEYRFIAIDGAGNVIDIQRGTLALSDTYPNVNNDQMAMTIGGAGHTFMDTAGNIHLFDQGPTTQTLEISGPGLSIVLQPSSPGWFVLNTAGLSGSYSYTVTARNAAGGILHKGSGSFTKGLANSVTEPTGAPIQTLQTVDVAPGTIRIGSMAGTSTDQWLSYTDYWEDYKGLAHPFTVSELGSRSFSVNLPDTSAWGSGPVQLAISVDAWTDSQGNVILAGDQTTVTIPGTQQSYTWNIPSAPVANISAGHPNHYTCSLQKWTSTGWLLVGEYSGTPTSVSVTTSGDFQTFVGNYSGSAGAAIATFDVSSSTATKVVLQYRRKGTNDGWAVQPLANSVGGYWGGPTRFLFDTAGLPNGIYEYRQVAMDSAGNVASTGTGDLRLYESAPTISENPTPIGGLGRVFMDNVGSGRLHFTEQGTNVATITVRYRLKNSTYVWSNPVTLGAGDRYNSIPGWFVFAPPGGMVAGQSYEIEFVKKDGAGNVLGHSAMSFMVGNPNSVSELQAYQGAPVVVRFSSLSLRANTARIAYRASGSSGAYTTVTAGCDSTGFFWDTSALNVPGWQAYDFTLEAYDVDGVLVNKSHGTMTLGDTATATLNAYVADAAPTLVNLNVPANNATAATATQMVLQYRLTGTSTYLTTTLLRTDLGKPFVLDASALIPPGATGSLDYIYTLKNNTGAIVKAADGSTIQVSGKVVLGAAPAAQTAISVSDTSKTYQIRRRQKTNAFGEVVQEIDANDYITDLTYNSLGKLILKQDPSTTATLENGLQKTLRPTTQYFYDSLGRFVGSIDANGYRNSQVLATGISAGQFDDQGNAEALVAQEFHADGGKVQYGYDAFGLKRYTVNELGKRSDYSYDNADRLTQVLRPVREAGSLYAGLRAYDTYTYDAAGNRITHSTSPDGATAYTDKTYYDALGRVTKGISAQGRTTTVSYTWDASLTSIGGAMGGWRKTTSDGLTGSTQYGTTISAMVDAADVFGRLLKHTDLGGRTYTYNYNAAGWLSTQTSSAGQSITYNYYANGYIKSTLDNVTGALTEYGYDKVGNRTYEAYSRLVNGSRVYEQSAAIAYDELNRVKEIKDVRATIRYEYDAVGNRRRVWSNYQDGVYGNNSTQDYWYLYDSMNRFTVTRGSLGARATVETDTNKVQASGANAVLVGYDLAGQRTLAVYAADGHREDYSYSSDGLLESTWISANGSAKGPLRASRYNDLMGRTQDYYEYSPGGSVTRHRTTVYDADNRETSEAVHDANGSTPTDSTSSFFLLADGTVDHVDTVTVASGANNAYSFTSYRYEWWDSAKQSRITEQTSGAWKPGVSHYTYDANGHIKQAIDELGHQSFEYITNAQGQVMQRFQYRDGVQANWHRFYYAEGRSVGDVGNDGDLSVDYATQLAQAGSAAGSTYTQRQEAYKNWRPVASADFDQNYQPITASYPGTAPGHYTVRAGDSLLSIAASQWGDASLWYLIAEANGLTASTSLTAGQTLSIPNRVTNVHNNSTTSRVYDAGRTMGDTSPTQPDPPPPPQKSHGCGEIDQLIVMVVAIVVTVYTAGAAAGWLGATEGGFGATMSLGVDVLSGTAATSTSLGAAEMVASAAIGGAAGSIASQGVAMAMGLQDHFSWSQVGMSALGAAVGSEIGMKFGAPANMGPGEAMLRAGGASIATQGIGSALGMTKFNWKGVAASAIGAGISNELGKAEWMQGLGPVVGGTLKGMTNGAVQAGIFGTKPNWGAIAAQSFGSAIGDSFASEVVRRDGVGNALGQGLVDQSNSTPTYGPEGQFTPTAENWQRLFDSGANTLRYPGVIVASNDVQDAPGDTVLEWYPDGTPKKVQLQPVVITANRFDEEEATYDTTRESNRFKEMAAQMNQPPAQPGFWSGLASSMLTAIAGGRTDQFHMTPQEWETWKSQHPNPNFGSELPSIRYDVNLEDMSVNRVIEAAPPLTEQLKDVASLGFRPVGTGLGNFFGGWSVAGDPTLSRYARNQGAYDAGANALSVPAAVGMVGLTGMRQAPGARPEFVGPLKTALSREEIAYYRRTTPNQVLRDMVNPVGPKIDPIYRYPVQRLEADHIIPFDKVIRMPGMEKLPAQDVIDVLNAPDNIMGVGKPTNASRQDRSYATWPGHSRLGPVDPQIRNTMMLRELEAQAALQREIQQRLTNGSN
jgi:YD repeat-containing protein